MAIHDVASTAFGSECYRVKVPEGARLTGVTVSGHPASIGPGEYLVHRLPVKPSLRQRLRMPADTWRFVGAHRRLGDVHFTLPEGRSLFDALPIEALPTESAAERRCQS